MKQLDPKAAINLGVLQEVNRLVLHPVGLALAVRTDDITGISSYFIWDAQDDPEGIYFDDVLIANDDAVAKAERMAHARESRAKARLAALGYVIQPVPGLAE